MHIFCNHANIAIQHSLIIGCGGRGTEAVAHCRDLFRQEVFSDETTLLDFNPLQFLVFDSATQNLEVDNSAHHIDTISIACDEGDLRSVIGSGAEEIMQHMPRRRNYARMVRGLPNPAMGNSTCPPLGSINFLVSWDRIKNELKQYVEKWQRAPEKSGLNVTPFAESNQIFIAASLYGGTGAGIHPHVAAMLRVILSELEISHTAIYAFFFLPDLVKNADETGKRKLWANAYASLKELDHFAAANPYRISIGHGSKIAVSNAEGNDVLFNKVFLVNDENEEDIKLDEYEAAKMVGEALFHFSGTALGKTWNQRLVDSPHEYCSMDAPDPGSGRMVPETRPRAYSTFGLATTRIPYDVLKNNLIVDCAVEIMNSCIHLPDDETPEEKRKLETENRWIDDMYLRVKDPLSHIGLDPDTLKKKFDERFRLPGFMHRKIGSGFEGYLEDQGEGFKDALGQLERSTQQTIRTWQDHEDAGDLFAEVKECINQFQDRLLNDKAGPDQTKRILSEFSKFIAHALNAHKDSAASMTSATEYLNHIQYILNQYQELQEEKIWPLFKKKFIGEAGKYFKRLKGNMNHYRALLINAAACQIFDQAKTHLDQMIRETGEEEKRYQRILECLRNMRLPYETSKLLRNAVGGPLLDRFIQQFPYKAEASPEDLAKKIQKEGLGLNGQKVPIASFPDQRPDDVAQELFQTAQRAIEDSVPDETWRKSFTQSGLYPKPGVQQEWESMGIDPRAYENTMQELLAYSAPFLEYREERQFDACRENFFIFPPSGTDSAFREEEIWKQKTLPRGRAHWIISGARSGNYSLTCFQFHFGIPLYSIDQFSEWSKAYNYMLELTDRPLHKFDEASMKEPLLDFIPMEINPGEIRYLFQWAQDISWNRNLYPVFVRIDKIPVLNALDNSMVKRFYYTVERAKYQEVKTIEERLEQEPQLRNYFTRLIYLNQPRTKALTESDLLAISNPDQCSARIHAVIRKLAEKGDALLHMRFQKIDSKDMIWISGELAHDRRVREIVRRDFSEALDPPEFKEGLDEKQVLAMIQDQPWFRQAFLSQCLQAVKILEKMGRNEYVPEIFRNEGS